MAQITNCLKLISRMPESDQDALVSRLVELQALGVPAQRAQVQAAIDLMARLEREANPQGIQRSAARDVTETPEFKRWFGASKVVDADGRPMVVYHGTRSDLQEFDRRFIGSATDEGFLGDGFYFTDSQRAASAYARGEGGNVVAAYVSIKNPYYAEGLLPDSMTAESLQASGFDGVIYQADGSGDYSEFVAFRPEQIKSAIGNRGTFDPDSPDITRSADRPEFFSQLQRSIEQVPDRLATMAAPQWKLWLDANAAKLGVKKDEIEWSGIKDYLTLRGKEKVTRDELVAYLGDSGVRVQETVLGNQNDRQKLSNEYGRAVAASDAAGGAMNPAYIESLAPGDRKPEEQALLDAWNRVNENPDESWLPEDGNPKYGQYTVPGGERYREVLITLPGEVSVAARIAALKAREISRKMRSAESDEEYEALRKERAVISGKAKEDPGYKSSHWDAPNVIAHIRVDDRVDADGKKILFVNELQSDFGQDYRKAKEAIESAVDADFQGIVERMKKAGVLEVVCD